ncbi:MAG TPA: TetR/AcrR family transcriptional regulator [Povalibacter sp.]|nr:TetR/AcrR family transcriptional regulator [Povalibacter sp.]
MARKPLTNPRKQASQARSRATVDVLIETTARILVREGFDRASTNRIAEQAGVSIGSLYQYFPGKDALVAAVIDRHREELGKVARSALLKASTQPLRQGIRTLVTAAVEAHRIDPRLHRVLAEQIPRTGRLEKVETFSRRNYALFKAYLERHSDELRTVDLELASFVCVTSVEALTHSAVLHNPAMLADDAALKTLIDETTRLIVGYLQ